MRGNVLNVFFLPESLKRDAKNFLVNKMDLNLRFTPGAHFSKVPIINGPGKLSPFTLKITGFNSFASNMIKLSANKNKTE